MAAAPPAPSWLRRRGAEAGGTGSETASPAGRAVGCALGGTGALRGDPYARHGAEQSRCRVDRGASVTGVLGGTNGGGLAQNLPLTTRSS